MQIQRIEISKLTGDPANARKHPERNIQTIVDSLNRFGQQKPVVIDSSNCVRAGNGTLEAARSLGWTFLGSGTTLIAAEQLGRTCYGMEISPAYVDVIVKRWENLTGQVAYRDGHTGHTNDEHSTNAAMADQTGVSAGDNQPAPVNRRKSKKLPA